VYAFYVDFICIMHMFGPNVESLLDTENGIDKTADWLIFNTGDEWMSRQNSSGSSTRLAISSRSAYAKCKHWQCASPLDGAAPGLSAPSTPSRVACRGVLTFLPNEPPTFWLIYDVLVVLAIIAGVLVALLP